MRERGLDAPLFTLLYKRSKINCVHFCDNDRKELLASACFLIQCTAGNNIYGVLAICPLIRISDIYSLQMPALSILLSTNSLYRDSHRKTLAA